MSIPLLISNVASSINVKETYHKTLLTVSIITVVKIWNKVFFFFNYYFSFALYFADTIQKRIDLNSFFLDGYIYF